MVKLCKAGLSKAVIEWKLGLLHQTVSQITNEEKMFLKEIKSATPVNTQMRRETALLLIKRVLVIWRDQASHNIALSQSLS